VSPDGQKRINQESTAAPRHLLWPLANFFWNLNVPYIWRLGNVVSDVRYFLYDHYGWEWV
jgi:hypothetical protein